MVSGPARLPLVSVIVPAHNAEATLRESLASALAGTYPHIELLVVDDGSTDGTWDIASALAARDDRVRVHRRERKGGVSAALNSGLALARGDYVARLDSDDLWHPAKIERQVALALVQPELAFIYTFVRYIDAEGRVLCDVAPQRFPRWALCRGIHEGLVGANSSAMMRRSAVTEVDGYDESLASWEDLLLELVVSARNPVGFIPEYLVGYRVRSGSLSADPENMLRSWRVARQNIARRFTNVPRFVHNWAHGKRCAEFAEAFAWRRRFAPALALLIEAFWHNPLWTFWFVHDRIRRRLSRHRTSSQQPRQLFLSCSPEQAIGLDSLAGRGLHRLNLDRRRDARLAVLDERLASDAII